MFVACRHRGTPDKASPSLPVISVKEDRFEPDSRRDRRLHEGAHLKHQHRYGRCRRPAADPPRCGMMPTSSLPLILASGSPRRVALLGELGVLFQTVASDEPETIDPRLGPEAQAV